MNIQVINAEHTANEPEFFAAVMARVARHTHGAKEITVYCNPRNPETIQDATPGWIEYGFNISYEDGGRLFIGAIQRKPDADIEFHSKNPAPTASTR